MKNYYNIPTVLETVSYSISIFRSCSQVQLILNKNPVFFLFFLSVNIALKFKNKNKNIVKI